MAGRKSTATMELAIGATIIAGVLILIVMLMAWGNSTSLLGRHYRVVVTMANVGGLKEGAPVKMGGFQIGRVATIQIRPGSTEMELVLDIDENRILPKGSTAKVSTAGLVGDAFMEIVPGKSSETLRRAATVADAEHLESSPLPDMSELMTKVNDFGEQLNILTSNLNDIVGDLQFRRALKSMAVNIDNVSHEANVILQRSQSVMDNIEAASQNINAGIVDARNALNSTLGNPDVAKNLVSAIANINSVTNLLAKRNDATGEMIANLSAVSGDLKAVSAHVRAITGDIDPAAVSATFNSLNSAIGSMTAMVEKVKSEPVLALSINKAADRIVKMKFDEMARARLATSDAVLDEINRWVKDGMDAGVLADPAYAHGARPYALPEVEALDTDASDDAADQQPYIAD